MSPKNGQQGPLNRPEPQKEGTSFQAAVWVDAAGNPPTPSHRHAEDTQRIVRGASISKRSSEAPVSNTVQQQMQSPSSSAASSDGKSEKASGFYKGLNGTQPGFNDSRGKLTSSQADISNKYCDARAIYRSSRCRKVHTGLQIQTCSNLYFNKLKGFLKCLLRGVAAVRFRPATNACRARPRQSWTIRHPQ